VQVPPVARLGAFTTRRLSLRPLAVDDVDHLVALDADPEVMRFLTGGVPSTREEVDAAVRASLDHRWRADTLAAGAFVGWFGLRPSADGEYELGYRLRRDAWGLGYATEASRALVDAAFGVLGARRVWAQTMAVNTSSRRVMERCGLRFVRSFHLEWADPIEGTELGEVEYELRADGRASHA
jgi:RimJ/RimL family protein N-acetyltransferase